MTVMVNVVVPDPPLLLAVMVWTVCASSAVGDPISPQVVWLSVSPAGRAGLAEQVTIAPPLRPIARLGRLPFFVRIKADGVYPVRAGGCSLTVMVSEAVPDPPVLVAVIW